MATMLYKLGRTAFRRRKATLAVWLVLLGGMFAAAATLSGPTTDAATMPGTESQRAIDLLEQRLPEANGASGRIVFAAPEGERLTAGERATAVADAAAAAAKAPGVDSVSEPLTSEDGRVALAQVNWATQADALPEGSVEAVQAAAETAHDAGVQVEFGGDAVTSEASLGGVGELIGFAVAALVLLITFGSLVAAGLPLLTALIGVVIGIMGITAVTGFVDMDSAVPTVALMLGLAVGIDYALFIISRHRAQLFEGMDPEESAARAVGTAGSAVVFAGATVVIALASLAVVGIPFMTAMGLAAAGTVAVAVAVSLTLVPALLGFAGMRMAKGKNFETGPRAAKPTLGARWVGLLTRRRVPAVVLSVARAGRAVDPRAGHAPRPAGRLDRRAAGDQPQGLRPARRRLRPGLQRPAHARGRRGRGREREGRGRRRRVGVRAARGRRRRRHAGPQRRRVTPRSSRSRRAAARRRRRRRTSSSRSATAPTRSTASSARPSS